MSEPDVEPLPDDELPDGGEGPFDEEVALLLLGEFFGDEGE